jgi:glucosyl-3-phosphoglycerate synthase
MSAEEAVAGWLERRSFDAGRFPLADLLARKRASVSAVLPARDVEATIGGVLAALTPLREAGLLDELVVVDGASRDATVRIAEDAGVPVLQESRLMPEHGPALGKGDAMWRGLAATSGEVVLFLDTDTARMSPCYALGLVGPLLADDGVALVKGAFRRPFQAGGESIADEGGRVTELVARPLLNLLVPELAGFRQPLAGELAARRSLLEAIPFPVGYGIEIGMLLDAHRRVGLDGLAQSDLGTRHNPHQPLRELSAMAYAVLVTALRRTLGEEALGELAPEALGMLRDQRMEVRDIRLAERPPLAGLRRPPEAG